MTAWAVAADATRRPLRMPTRRSATQLQNAARDGAPGRKPAALPHEDQTSHGAKRLARAPPA
eukprot:4650101-Lingulodinium_polyedra.AAC.1